MTIPSKFLLNFYQSPRDVTIYLTIESLKQFLFRNFTEVIHAQKVPFS